MSASLLHAALLLSVPFTSVLLPAQREAPKFEWQKRKTVLDYGVTPVGKHSLSDLEVGGSWRLGMNDASTWQLEMPLLAGETLLPPGHYRVSLRRAGEEQLAIVLAGTGRALGLGDADLEVKGQLGKLEKPTSKLEIGWRASKKAPSGAQNREVALEVRFGAHQWSADLVALGGKPTSRLGGYMLTTFLVPSELVLNRSERPVPVATLRLRKESPKAPDGWNIVLAADGAKLVPWMRAPTDSFGFGAVVPPDESWTTSGTIEETESPAEAEVTLDLRDAKLERGELTFQLAAGTKLLTLALPEPKGKVAGKQ